MTTDRTWRSRVARAVAQLKASTPTAMRAAAIGSAFTDLGDDWTELTEEQRRRARLGMNIGSTALAALAALLVAGTVFDLFGTNVVHVFARTEHVLYTPLRADPPQWLLENVEIHAGSPSAAEADEEFDALFESIGEDGESDAFGGPSSARLLDPHFDGFYQPRCGDTITVGRVGTGPLEVSVSSVHAARFTDPRGFAPPSGDVLAIATANEEGTPFVTDFTIRARHGGAAANGAGGSILWPLEGRIDAGREVGPQTHGRRGLLLDGKVEVVAGRLADFTYAADQHTLELGDHVVLPNAERLARIGAEIGAEDADGHAAGDRPSIPADRLPVSELCTRFSDPRRTDSIDMGFIHFDERRGMNVSLSSNSPYAEIHRYRTTPIRVENNWIKRLVRDPFLSIGWTALGLLFFLYRRVARWYVSSNARRRREREA